jgi:F-type H+-transporting ATPase subunit epsilon
MATLQCEVVTPSGAAFSGPAEMIVVPGAEGELGVLPRHAPLVARLRAGEVRVRTDGTNWQAFVTSEGYFKVQFDIALVLVADAEPADRLDVAAAERDAEDARARLAAAERGDQGVDRFRAERDLAWAENRLRVGRR